MHFGILNVNKPPGVSSRKVVDWVERCVGKAKCGHAGTLDPLASGVLVICVGPATRLISYVQQMPKTYRATFLLGRSSPTDDMEGEITLLEGAPQPTAAQLDAVLPQFLGTIAQTPPTFSAVKVAGRRSYALARRGEAVELAPRSVTIHRLEVRRFEYPELELDIECSSGTYVRSIGRDLAQALGTVAVMSALERTAIGAYRVADAIRVDDLSADNLSQNLLAAVTAVAELPKIEFNHLEIEEIRNGRPVGVSTDGGDLVAEQVEVAAVGPEDQLVAIVRQKKAGQWWPVLNFR